MIRTRSAQPPVDRAVSPGNGHSTQREDSSPRPVSGQYRGIVLILISYAFLTGEGAAVHQIGAAASPMQCVLLRSIGSLVLVAILSRKIGLTVFRTQHLPLQFVRGGLTVVSMWAIFYGFSFLPLADATAVSYTRGVFLSVLAAAILREQVTTARWSAAVVALVGCLIIVRPAFAEWQPDYMIMLAGAALNAGAMIATKILERTDTPLTVLAYMSLISAAACLSGLSEPWPSPEVWPWLLAIALLGPAALYTGLLAIRAADMSVIAPFDYTRLIMAAAIGLTLFGESPNATDFAGAAIVTLACIWAAASAQPRRLPAS